MELRTPLCAQRTRLIAIAALVLASIIYALIILLIFGIFCMPHSTKTPFAPQKNQQKSQPIRIAPQKKRGHKNAPAMDNQKTIQPAAQPAQKSQQPTHPPKPTKEQPREQGTYHEKSSAPHTSTVHETPPSQQPTDSSKKTPVRSNQKDRQTKDADASSSADIRHAPTKQYNTAHSTPPQPQRENRKRQKTKTAKDTQTHQSQTETVAQKQQTKSTEKTASVADAPVHTQKAAQPTRSPRRGRAKWVKRESATARQHTSSRGATQRKTPHQKAPSAPFGSPDGRGSASNDVYQSAHSTEMNLFHEKLCASLVRANRNDPLYLSQNITRRQKVTCIVTIAKPRTLQAARIEKASDSQELNTYIRELLAATTLPQIPSSYPHTTCTIPIQFHISPRQAIDRPLYFQVM